MATLFAGAELDAFLPDNPNAIEVTTGGSFDSTYSRCSMRVGGFNLGHGINSPVFADQTDVWVRWNHWNALSVMASQPMILRTSAGVAVFRVAIPSTSPAYQMQYWNGSTWVNIGSSFSYTFSSLGRYALHIWGLGTASGEAEIYRDGLLMASGSADFSSMSGVGQLRFQQITTTADANRTLHVSEAEVATHSLISSRLTSKPPTGNGTDTDGTGGFGDIDEIAYSEADNVVFASGGQKNSFTSAARVLTGRVVKSVTVSARIKAEAVGPQSARFYLLISGTRYYGSTFGLTTAYLPYVGIWDTNPATGVAWTISEAQDAALQWGVEAIT